MSAIYDKIEFEVGEGVAGTQAYRVVRDGVETGFFDLSGNPINVSAIPGGYGYKAIEYNAPTPSWG